MLLVTRHICFSFYFLSFPYMSVVCLLLLFACRIFALGVKDLNLAIQQLILSKKRSNCSIMILTSVGQLSQLKTLLLLFFFSCCFIGLILNRLQYSLHSVISVASII